MPRLALKTPFRDGTVQDIARRILPLAHAGLERRGRKDGFGETEAHFLNALIDIADSGQTAADQLLDLYHGPWNGSVDPVYRRFAY